MSNLSPSPFKLSESQSPSKYESPIKKFGLAKLEKISEKDSFCTDASMISFCSDELHSSKKKRKTENVTLAKYNLLEDHDIIDEEDGDDESLAEHLRVVAGGEEDDE